MSLRIVPVSLDQANDYVDRLHRHSDPLPGCRYAIGVEDDSGELHGVAIIGNPSSPGAALGLLMPAPQPTTPP